MKTALKTIAAIVFSAMSFVAYGQNTYTLKDSHTEVQIGSDGTLLTLKNVKTGHDYAGGANLWRVFYNTLDEK